MRRAHDGRAHDGRARHGFTIVEVVVALAIAGLVALVAFATVGIAGDASARLRQDQGAALGGLAVRATVEGWLRAATLVEGQEPFVGVRGRGTGLPFDEVAFAVRDGGPLYPGPWRVRLHADRDPDTPADGLVAELTSLRDPRVRDTLALAPGVGGLALRYRVTAVGRSRWVDDWDSVHELPAAVELRLHAAAEATPASPSPSPLVMLPLVAAVGWEGR